MPALAQDVAVEPVHIVYHAAAECPREAEFERQLTMRTARMRTARPGEPARTFALAVDSQGGEHRARLRIITTDGSVTVRELAGDDCADVVSAMALIVALDIDPSASTSPVPAAETGGAAPPFTTPPAASTDAAAVPGTALPAEPPGPPGRTQTPTEPRGPAEAGFHPALGASVQSLVGLVPAPALGGGLFVEFARARAPFVPSVRASFVIVAAEASLRGPIGSSATWYYARVEGCPLRPFVDRVRIDACAFLDAGALGTSGQGLDHQTTALQSWFGAGLLGRIAWSAAARVELEAGGGFVVPLRRYTFQYDPGTGELVEIKPVSSIGAVLFAGATFRL